MLSRSEFAAAGSITAVLDGWAERHPDTAAYVYLGDGDTPSADLSFGKLRERALAIAANLAGRLRTGDRALLAYADGLTFIEAFFGCLYAGVLPVPVIPPRRNRRLDTCEAIARDCEARLVLTGQGQVSSLEQSLRDSPTLGGMTVLATDAIADAGGGSAFDARLGETAFLQYTSGSTGLPKGVVVSHANLMNNERAVAEAFRHDCSTVFVGWLPLFHDMGLIGNVLQPMFLGITAYLMPASAFLQSPLRWLRAISNYQATTSGAPNFAYELCVKKVREADCEGLDLSSWRVAFNGSEPVRADTLLSFSETFGRWGFRDTAHYPCYGMAETTLFIAGGVQGERRVVSVNGHGLEENRVQQADTGAVGALALVGCGQAWLGNRLLVVDPSTLRRASGGQVGEIWVQGPSVTHGYWNQPSLAEEMFRARVADEPEAGEWLRTGDLGFADDSGLFVTGRLKDLVIIRGRNHYPQDIERTAERSSRWIATGRVAAFSLSRGRAEELAVVAEIDFAQRSSADPLAIAQCIRAAIIEHHEIVPAQVRVVGPGELPMTSSGKPQRKRCRQMLEAGELKAPPEAKRKPTAIVL